MDTQVSGSCSVKWKNQFYVFGGLDRKQQVSMVTGNRLQRKTTLEFYFQFGSCTVLNQITIVLCFDKYGTKVCRQLNNPLGSYTKLPNSNFKHKYARIASFDGEHSGYKKIITIHFRHTHWCWNFL